MLRLSTSLVSLRLRFVSNTGNRIKSKLSGSLGYFGEKSIATMANNPIQSDISNRLNEVFNPLHLTIENESYKHSVPKGSETHFKVIVVSEKFEGIALIEQHRMVNEALEKNLKNGVHALAIKTMTPKKWATLQASDPSSAQFTTPNCLGGSKHDKK